MAVRMNLGRSASLQFVNFSNSDSMTQIGIISANFSLLALPFLVDMFNDEDVNVRLFSVQSVAFLNSLWKMTVNDKLVKAVILILRDFELSVRHFAHKMIRQMPCYNHRGLKFESSSQYTFVMEVLIRELKESASTSEKVCMETISILAKNHPGYTEDALYSNLGVKKHFLPKEGRIDDITRSGLHLL